MNYKEFREHVMDLLNQRSSNGEILDNLYNDQSDYLIRIPSLYNSAVTDVSVYKEYTGVLDYEICVPEPISGNYVKIATPDDYIRMLPVLTFVGGVPTRSSWYYELWDHEIAIQKDLLRPGVVLRYVKRPAQLDTTLGADIDHVMLDGDEEQQHAAALWVAARLAIDESAFLYSSLMNEYDARINEFKSRRSAEILSTTDVYGSADVYGGYGYES